MSQPACKLIEAVQSAVGLFYEPWHIKRMAKARKIVAITEAETNLELNRMASRASIRMDNWKLRRQMNIEAIVNQAIKDLPDTVSTEDVAEDWVYQFFEACQDVGDKQMQSLWARLLAGEVSEPGSYSPRTLQLVRTLRPSDAELFTHFCNYVWLRTFHFYCDRTDEYLKDKGILYFDLMHLESIGLVQLGTGLGYNLNHDKEVKLYFNDKLYTLTIPKDKKKKRLKLRSLTHIGKELVPISGADQDEEYSAILVEEWEKEGVEIKVSDLDTSEEGIN